MFKPRWAVLIILACSFVYTSVAPLGAQVLPGGRDLRTAAGIPLAINEFMAANSSFDADPQGQFDDWVEIHNAGPQAIDVAGMYLTDDLSKPTQWRFPSGDRSLTMVAAGGFLRIWVDGDTTDPGLHAGFGLNAAGDEIALFDTDGVSLIDHIVFAQQVSDISFGRFPDGTGDWQFLFLPSPGTPNISGYEGRVAEPKFSRERGFYDESFEVTLTCATPEATVYYSLDGSDPYGTAGRGPVGRPYDGPIPITTTTCLRARAVRTGWLPSEAGTHTYLFLDDVITRSQSDVLVAGYPGMWFGSFRADYEMDPEVTSDPVYGPLMRDAMLDIPTLSLVTDKDNFFNRTKDPKTGGIYVYTGHSSTGGQDWERPVSVEMFEPDGAREFQVDCGIRIQGGEGRKPEKCPKHSFGLRFRGEYGASQLEFPLFGGPVEAYDTLQLRAFFNNSWVHWASQQRERTQYIRDQWQRDSLLEMGHADSGRGFFAHLYINGIYWGLHNIHERPVATHYAAYNGGDPDRIDAINGGHATDGTVAAWQETRNIVASRDWSRIVEVLDIDSFIDWSLLNLFAGNEDLKTDGNWRAAGGGADRRPWRFYCWDAEHVLENVNRSGTSPSDDPTGMFRSLVEIEEFRLRFGDRVHKHLFNGGALTTERNIERWQRRADEIELAVIGESARWGDYRRDVHPYSSGPYRLYTRDEFWLPQKEWLLNDYFPRRTDIALNQFKSRGLYPAIDAPGFNVNGAYQHGGYADVGAALAMSGGSGTTWYTLDGSDPRVPGTAGAPSDVLTLVAEEAAKRVLVPTESIDDAWRGGAAFDDAAWQTGTGGVGYERSTGYEAYFDIDVRDPMYAQNTSCYVRIPFAVAAGEIDALSTLLLNVRYDDGFVAYLNGVEVQRAQFNGTPTWNSSAAGNHSDIDAVDFETFNLSPHIDALRQGANILAIHAANSSTTSSDFLISVELTLAQSAGGTPSGVSPTAFQYTGSVPLEASVQVKARARSGNTWSALNEAVFAVGPVAESLRISEVMYHPSDPNTEYIELTNIGAAPLNLNLVRFVNGVDFTFGRTALAPGAYCLVVSDKEAFEARHGAHLDIAGQYAGSLNNGGERLALEDAAGRTIHTFRFRDGWYDVTDGGGFSLTVKDPATVDPNALGDKAAWRPSAAAGGSPGFDDTGDLPELGAVVINELLANSEAGTPDWIELHNTTDQTLNIGGWFLSDDADDLMKYEIAPGTPLAAHGYLVLYEDRHFGNTGDPGCHSPFKLSRDGETVTLHSGADGVLTGYSEEEKFDASDPGVTLGRYRKSSGTYNFVALTEPTPGWENAAPQVGPVVITEIMYHPDDPADAEYVELMNISDAPVTFYDSVRAAPWRLTDDPDQPNLEFLFPTDHPLVLAPGQRVVIAKDLALAESRYELSDGVLVFAWGPGKLANGSEKIQLSKPGDADAAGTRHWIRVDRVVYSDGSHPEDFPDGIDPWPTDADGLGAALGRIVPEAYGNDPANWQATPPSPGTAY